MLNGVEQEVITTHHLSTPSEEPDLGRRTRGILRCERNQVTLRELEASSNNGLPYLLKYWYTPFNKTRIIDVFIVFPIKERPLLDEYSFRLFPDIPSCEDLQN